MTTQSACRSGISILEAMVAVGIAMFILLLVAAAVRSTSQTLRGIQNAIDENQAMQRGWIEALHDADYWMSHASPDFPYLAGYQSETVSIGGDTDHPWDKRPFRPVTFRPGLNPHELLPHDARSWYRGGAMVMTTPVSRPAPSYEPTFVWIYTIDAIASPFSTTNVGLPRYPAGWSPWHQMGDYAELSRALAKGDGSTEWDEVMLADASSPLASEAPRSVTDAMPSLQWWLFSELGHLGASTYLPRGTITLINRPTANRTSANIGNADTYFDWGEIPFALARGGPAGPESFAPEGFTNPAPGDFPNVDWVRNLRRRNMLIGMPGSGSDLTAINSKDLHFPNKWEKSSSFTNERSGFNTAFATDYDAAASRSAALLGNWNSGTWLPHASMFPTRAFRIGDDWDTWSLIDRTVMDPFRLLADDERSTTTGYFTASTTGTTRVMDERFVMETRHMPAVASNDDRRPEGYQGLDLAHRIVRYRQSYAERTKVTIILQNPRSDRSLTVFGSVLGSTYLGARMHWGWKSAVRSDLPPMGDRYAP